MFSLILAAVTVACTLYLPILTGDAINLILSPGQVDFNGIKPILYKGAAVIIIGAAAQWIMNICNNRITMQLCVIFARRLLKRLKDFH